MKRLTPSTVIACLALFFSLGGAGYAAVSHYRIWSIHQIKPSVQRELRRTENKAPFIPAPSVGVKRSAAVTVMPGSDVTVLASCQGIGTGSATGGGFHASPGLTVLASEPSTSDSEGTWQVVFHNSTTSPLQGAASVVCAIT